jgi:hypothetical protein
MKDQESTTRTPPDREIAEAASAVYRKYGTNLSAFWRDAFAAEAQRHGDQVERYGVDGNCIHSIPICHACQVTGVEVHIKETDRIRTGIRNEVYDAALAVLCDPDVMDDPDQANTLAGRIADRSREYLTAAVPAPQPVLDAGEWQLSTEMVNRAIADGIRGGATITAIDVAYGEGRKHYGQIVVFENAELAAQIVSGHTSAAAVAKLVQALKHALVCSGTPDDCDDCRGAQQLCS